MLERQVNMTHVILREEGREREREVGRREGGRWRRKMKRWICWTDKSTRHR